MKAFEYSKRSGPAVRRIVQEWESNPEENITSTWLVNTGIKDMPPDRSPSKAHQPSQWPGDEPLSWTYGKLTPQSATAWLQTLERHGSVSADQDSGRAKQRAPMEEQRSSSEPTTAEPRSACPPTTAEPRSACQSTTAEHHTASAEQRSACKPTTEQLRFLRAVIDRCLQESLEEQDEKSRSEPLRAVFHGVPGAGKSQTLKWLRAFFEEVCGWQHQQEFVYLAPQNTQAALIAGMTLHSFANIQVKTKTARAKQASTPKQFARYQRLRWIVVDESSTVGLEILATLEKRLQQSTRDRDTWKLRQGGQQRPFGGRNIILTGDLWQFPLSKPQPSTKTLSSQIPASKSTPCNNSAGHTPRSQSHTCLNSPSNSGAKTPGSAKFFTRRGMETCRRKCGLSYTGFQHSMRAPGPLQTTTPAAAKKLATTYIFNPPPPTSWNV